MTELFDAAFKERYRIDGPLGTGGTGQVFRAWQASLERFVAVKFINPRLFKDKEVVERFRQEGAIASRLVHPNIVQVYDVGESGGYPYIVYELIEGRDLAEHVQRAGAIAPAEAMDIMAAITEGLAYAHRLGVIHRDLKAENILIERGGAIKIADFGIAKWEGSSLRTETGVVLGTPSYMAPEQVRGEKVTPRTDVYALGVIFYEMLTGRLPFFGKTPMETALKQLHDEAPRIDVPGAGHLGVRLDRLIRERMLAKDPDERFPDAESFLARLRDVREGREGEVSTRAVHVERDGFAEAPTRAATSPAAAGRESTVTGGTRPARGPKGTLARSQAGTMAMERQEAGGGGAHPPAAGRHRPLRDRAVVLGLLGALGTLVLVLGLGRLLGPGGGEAPGGGWDVTGVREEPGLYEVTISWRSTEPYPSAVRIWPRGEPGRMRLVADPEGARPVTSHRITAEDLSESSVYQYRVVLPGGGASIPRQFTTRGFRLVKSSASWLGAGRLVVEAETVNPHQVRLVLTRDGQPLAERVSPGLTAQSRFEVEVPSFHRPLAYSLFFYAAVGDKAPIKLLPDQPVESFTGKVARNADALIKAVDELRLGSVMQQAQSIAGRSSEHQTLLSRLAARVAAAVAPSLASFREDAPWFMSDRSVSPATRQRVYRAVADLDFFHRYAASAGVRSGLDLAGLLGGVCEVRTAPALTEDDVLELPLRFRSPVAPHPDLPLGGDPSARRRPEPLLVERAGTVERAELVMQGSGFGEGEALEVGVEGSALYQIWPRSGAGTWTLVQEVDPRFLREGGPTVFTFDLNELPGTERSAAATLERVTLRIHRGR